MIASVTEPETGYFDRHSAVLCIIVTILLLLYSLGMLLAWFGLTFANDTDLTYGICLVLFPSELAILSSFSPKWRGGAFRKMQVKSHPMWLLLNEIFRTITFLDLGLAGAAVFAPTLFLFTPIVSKSGIITLDRIAPLWTGMAVLALFSVVYGRSVMQTIGMRYETIGGGSLLGAGAFGALASLKFKSENRSGLDYLLSSFGHLKGAFASRGAELEGLEDARLAVMSMLDYKAKPPYEPLQVLADKLATLPNVLELPYDLKTFLAEIKWPGGIKSLGGRRGYGIEWVAAVATVAAATVGLFASAIQASGNGPFTKALLSPPTVYFMAAAGLFITVSIIGYSMSQYSVEIRDINALSGGIMWRTRDLAGKTTTLRTILVIPEAAVAAFSGLVALSSAVVVLGTASGIFIASATFLISTVIVFAVFSLLTWVLGRDVWRVWRAKKMAKLNSKSKSGKNP